MADWRDYAPRGVWDPNGPDGEPIPTPMDHRWLWHIEGELSVGATTDSQRRLQAALRSYLSETCQHHYRAYAGEPDIPAHQQCLWCCDVIWLDGEASEVSRAR